MGALEAPHQGNRTGAGEHEAPFFRCWIPGEAKSFIRRDRTFNLPGGKVGRLNYMNPRSAEWKSWMKFRIEMAMEELGLSVPYSGAVWYRAVCVLPKSKSARKSDFYHIKKPDKTNMDKLMEDALIGLVIVDDSQVVDGQFIKKYHSEALTGIYLELGKMGVAFDGTDGHGFKSA